MLRPEAYASNWIGHTEIGSVDHRLESYSRWLDYYRSESIVQIDAQPVDADHRAAIKRHDVEYQGQQMWLLRDPLQLGFDPIDLSWLTFILIYTGLGVALILFSRPRRPAAPRPGKRGSGNGPSAPSTIGSAGCCP